MSNLDLEHDQKGWAPRDLPVGIYCSPRCGGRCTRAAFDYATREAAALADRMGPGWSPHVWENLGWHYRAVKGKSLHHSGLAEIHPSPGRFGGDEPKTYSAWINPATDGVHQVITEYVSDPVEALGLALQEARTLALRFSAELDFISREPE